MIRATLASQSDADHLWRMLDYVPDGAFVPVEVAVEGEGVLYVISRDQAGDQIGARA